MSVPARSGSRLESLAVQRLGPDIELLDVSDVSWLDPLHLVGIAAAAHRAALHDRRLRLTGLGENQAGYAARMRLGQVIDRFGGQHRLPVVRELDRRDSLLEVTELSTPSGVRNLAGLVFDRVSDEDATLAEALWHGLAEIGGNVCEHAQSIGFMAAQTIHEHGVLRFAVADCGVGLLATLAAQGAVDDRAALNMALSGTSRFGQPGHGTGLPSTIEVVSGLDGEVLLASGTAATSATARGRRHLRLRAAFSGTIFEGSVPAAGTRHRRADLYAETRK